MRSRYSGISPDRLKVLGPSHTIILLTLGFKTHFICGRNQSLSITAERKLWLSLGKQ